MGENLASVRPGAKGLWMRNRCGSGLEDEGRRAGPRTMPAKKEGGRE